MEKIRYLILENGMVFPGTAFGAEQIETIGEVVFTTAMTGYCETLTDPSYFGQIIVQAFPLMGNYGVIPADFESGKIYAKGYVVSDWCVHPSNFRQEGTLDAFLKAQGIPGIAGVDTRMLIQAIRGEGTMNGKISDTPKVDAAIGAYAVRNAVASVSVKKKNWIHPEGKWKVALLDFGCKENIIRELIKRDCCVLRLPAQTTAEAVLAECPDGIFLSNGPGDPAENTQIIAEIKKLMETQVPMFGICLGHQLMALANGFATEKMKFGHRGANQPAKHLESGRIYITSQNHGYGVVNESVAADIAQPLFLNVNDGTNEGLCYRRANAFSVQFHPEGCGGPQDTAFLFDWFVERMEEMHRA